jgi:hypothetical protein
MNSQLTKLFLLSLFLISCSNSNENLNSTLNQVGWQESAGSNKNQNVSQNAIPADLDSKFETFIKYFSKDSLFQIGRIDFPLKVQNRQENKIQDVTIQKSKFHKLDFDVKTAGTRMFDKYNQNIKVEGNQAKIEIRGVDNGIFIDVYFEKISKKWKLVTWVDSSD